MPVQYTLGNSQPRDDEQETPASFHLRHISDRRFRQFAVHLRTSRTSLNSPYHVSNSSTIKSPAQAEIKSDGSGSESPSSLVSPSSIATACRTESISSGRWANVTHLRARTAN